MVVWWMNVIALGAPAQPEVHSSVEALYGREIPEAAVCIGDPTDLPGRFDDATAVGVRRGARGCVLVGVWIDGELIPPEGAATVALDEEAWQMVDAQQRASDLQAWTHGILLAFDQPVDEGTQRAIKGGFVVEQGYLHRADAAGVTTDSQGTWRFDASAALTEQSSAPDRHHKTVLSVRPDRLTGDLTSEIVEAALFEKGRAIKDCFVEAWEQDLTLDGRVRFAWSVSEGKVSDLSVIEDARPLSMDLARCYATSVRKLAFPEDLTGGVRWVFATTRSDVEAP